MQAHDIKDVILKPNHPVKIGKIGRVYGVLGWVKIISFTDKINSIFNYNPWFIFLECSWKLIFLDTWRLLGKNYIAKIKDISDRESALFLMNHFIFIDIIQLPCLQNDEYYCKDLIGCAVVLVDGEVYLGYVTRIIETTANDVLVVQMYEKNDNYKLKECLVPFVQDQVIKNVNLDARVITVDWDIDF